MKTISNLQFTIYKKQRGFIQHQFGAGFTLIELLVVIGIIGILSSFLMVNFIGVRQSARDGVRKSDLRQIQAALELYRSDQGVYPNPVYSGTTTLKCGCELTTVGAYCLNVDTGPSGTIYMQKIPCDPTNTEPYTYKYTSNGSTYHLAACLENIKDTQRDPTQDPGSLATCDEWGTANWSYTLSNP